MGGNIATILNSYFFISLPENPRLSSLGMNGTRSEAEVNHLFKPKLRALARGAASFPFQIAAQAIYIN